MIDLIGFIFVIGLITMIFVLGFGIGYLVHLYDKYKYYKREYGKKYKK